MTIHVTTALGGNKNPPGVKVTAQYQELQDDPANPGAKVWVDTHALHLNLGDVADLCLHDTRRVVLAEVRL